MPFHITTFERLTSGRWKDIASTCLNFLCGCQDMLRLAACFMTAFCFWHNTSEGIVTPGSWVWMLLCFNMSSTRFQTWIHSPWGRSSMGPSEEICTGTTWQQLNCERCCVWKGTWSSDNIQYWKSIQTDNNYVLRTLQGTRLPINKPTVKVKWIMTQIWMRSD